MKLHTDDDNDWYTFVRCPYVRQWQWFINICPMHLHPDDGDDWYTFVRCIYIRTMMIGIHLSDAFTSRCWRWFVWCLYIGMMTMIGIHLSDAFTLDDRDDWYTFVGASTSRRWRWMIYICPCVKRSSQNKRDIWHHGLFNDIHNSTTHWTSVSESRITGWPQIGWRGQNNTTLNVVSHCTPNIQITKGQNDARLW